MAVRLPFCDAFFALRGLYLGTLNGLESIDAFRFFAFFDGLSLLRSRLAGLSLLALPLFFR
jgi:hypothetical protein